MNRPFTESPQVAPAPHPILAAAAAMPPPPSPVIPLTGKSAPVTSAPQPAVPPPFRQEFPFDGAMEQNGGAPAPWTLPSMPLPPVEARPLPAELRPPSPAVPAPRPDAALPPGLVNDVINTLEEGCRTLTDVFQSLIGKLESTLAAPHPAPAAAIPTPLFPAPSAPGNGAFRPVDLPSLLVKPGPPATPCEATTPVAMPPFAASIPLAGPPPVAMPAPACPSGSESSAGTPRRRFARPSGLAAQQLSTTLNRVFESAPPISNGNGYTAGSNHHGKQPHPSNIPSQAVPIPVPPVAPRTQIPAPESIYSPFAVSSAPLEAPEGVPGEPAPFTFLTNNSGHFETAVPAMPAKAYDPLDDTTLPWMQPLAAHATRN